VMIEGLVGRRFVPHTLLQHARSNIGAQRFDIHGIVSKLIFHLLGKFLTTHS
jgi:hypothetical protein